MSILTWLLNDKDFNETFPIMRESFKDIYYLMEKINKDLNPNASSPNPRNKDNENNNNNQQKSI